MNNKRIIDYVMQSPNNTNPAVLESMLEAINGGSGGGGLPVLDFTDLAKAWEPVEDDENEMMIILPRERAEEAAQTIYSIFASKKYTPVTVVVQLGTGIMVMPCAVAMQEGGVRLVGEVSYGRQGSVNMMVTISSVINSNIMLQLVAPS